MVCSGISDESITSAFNLSIDLLTDYTGQLRLKNRNLGKNYPLVNWHIGFWGERQQIEKDEATSESSG